METNLDQAFKEFNDSLFALRKAVLALKDSQLEVKNKMAEAMEHSHLKSTITMLNQDIVLRRQLEDILK